MRDALRWCLVLTRLQMLPHPAARYAIVFVVVVICVGLPVSSARSQTLFDSLFGWIAKPAPKRPVVRYRDARPRLQPGPYPGYYPRNESQPESYISRPRSQPVTRYRTMCVRVCDGYYFPISFSATRSDLVRDSEVCHSRCGYMGTLFYTRSPRGDISEAVDLDGRKYKDINEAFRYRKTYVKGCTCRPAPWSKSERARHAGYAASETPKMAKGPTATVVAGNYDDDGNAAKPNGSKPPPPLPVRVAVNTHEPASSNTATAHGAEPGDAVVPETGAPDAGPARSEPASAEPAPKEARPAAKPSRRARWNAKRSRARRVRPAKPGPFAPLLGSGPSKSYAWPGDAS